MKKSIWFAGAAAVCLTVAASAALGSGAARASASQQASAMVCETPVAYAEPPAEEQTTVPAPRAKRPAAEPMELTQEAVLERCLNAVDYYTAVTLRLEASLVAGNQTEVAMQVDMDTVRAHEAVQENGAPVSETFCDGTQVLEYHYDSDAVRLTSGCAVRWEDTVLPEGVQRVLVERDGAPGYRYRANPTNLPLASFSLLPQEFAFGFLSDFSKWEITGTDTYLGRECVVVKGQVGGDYGQKLRVSDFEMRIDRETGILLDYHGYAPSGDVRQYVTVTAVDFSASPAVASLADCQPAVRAMEAGRYS